GSRLRVDVRPTFLPVADPRPGGPARRRLAVTAIGHDEDPHALLERAEGTVEGVVDEFGVVEAPRLVVAVLLVAVLVGDLPAVSGVGEEEEVAVVELGGVLLELLLHGADGRIAVDELFGREAALLGDRLHGVRVVDTARQRTVPA